MVEVFDGHRFSDWTVTGVDDEDNLARAMEELEDVIAGRSPDDTYRLLWSHWGDDKVYLRVWWTRDKRRAGRLRNGVRPEIHLQFANAFMRYPRTDIEPCDCGRAFAEAPADRNMCAICGAEWEERWQAAKVAREAGKLICRLERGVHERQRRQRLAAQEHRAAAR